MFKISVVIPTYNRANLIVETLDSIIGQTYANWECLVIDDHSTDDTAGIVSTYTAKDSRITYSLNQRAKGAQGARNTGIQKAIGEYIIFLDSDDLLDVQCLEQRTLFVQQNKGYDFYCFPTLVFYKQPHDANLLWNYLHVPDESDDMLRFLGFDMPWHTSGVLWTKTALQKLNGWDEALACWQDWDIHVRAVTHPALTYIKADNYSVDSYYRKDLANAAISKLEATARSVESKMYLMDKFFKLLNLPAGTQKMKMAYARLLYKMAADVNKALGNETTLKFMQAHLAPLGFTAAYIKRWTFYLLNRRNPKYPKALLKMLDVLFYVYKDTVPFGSKTTFLKATLK